MDEMAVDNPNPHALHSTNRAEHSKYKMLSNDALRKVQIEKLRLDFLLKCRSRKRPPPTLRCTGFKALNEEERIKMISEAETKSLRMAIENKKKEIKISEMQIAKSKQDVGPGLSRRERRWWVKHFKRKIKFFKIKKLLNG